jgi:hypothetical protein
LKDLSEMARGSLTMDSSMHAGNTISVNPPFSPAGSESEASQGIQLHSRPEPDLGPNNDGQLTGNRKTDAGAFHASALTWKKL